MAARAWSRRRLSPVIELGSAAARPHFTVSPVARFTSFREGLTSRAPAIFLSAMLLLSSSSLCLSADSALVPCRDDDASFRGAPFIAIDSLRLADAVTLDARHYHDFIISATLKKFNALYRPSSIIRAG